jgi:signal peptide peptidase SppA
MSLSEATSVPIPKQHKISWLRIIVNLILCVVLPLTGGFFLSRRVVVSPAVGIIRLNIEIYNLSADFISQQIVEARADPRIKAVVVQIDSPGGEVTATQTIYLELQKLRRDMPVVGSIDSMAASGAFYAVMATDPIYAKPSSTIGNVGVWGYFPSEIGVNDVVLASGPFKLTASNTEEFLRGIESIKQEFIATVISQRGTRMKISDIDLSQGLAYSGRESLNLGLIDALGGQTEAIEKAAKLAGIAHYKVIDLEAVVIDKYYSQLNPILANPWIGKADPMSGKRELPPGAYLLYDPRLGSTR